VSNAYDLVCPFLDDSPQYAAGVEFGLLYARLRRRPRSLSDLFTVANQEQILLLASRLGYRVDFMSQMDRFWFALRLERKDT
jgi:hypothetical protein